MKHLKSGKKFHRHYGKRRALMKGLLNNLIINEGIITTEAKAKEIRPRLEKLITVAKKQNLASLKILISRLPKAAAYKMYHEIAPRYKDVRGGYLRIVKSSAARKSDGSKMARIEFV